MSEPEAQAKKVKVPITADISHLSPPDRRAFEEHMVPVVKLMDTIYGIQRNQGWGWGFEPSPEDFDHSRGTNFYPDDLTKGELERYLEKHPERKEQLLSPYTVVRRWRDGFRTFRYSSFYDPPLYQVYLHLNAAADSVTNESLRKFLKRRAHAFAGWTNKNEVERCKQSDIDWINVSGARIELTLGAHESYDDALIGAKRSFEGILGVVLERETGKVRQYLELAKEFDRMLAQKYGYTPSGALTTAVVIDEVLAGGFCRFGFVPQAYVLPNDVDIRQSVGTKKVFIRNSIEAKFEHITRVIAERVLPSGVVVPDPELHFLHIVAHELAHDLGLYFKGGDFQELASPLEELKADVFGVLYLHFLAQEGAIGKELATAATLVHVADLLRQIRFGVEEAHGSGSLVQLRWFITEDALRFERNRSVELYLDKLLQTYDKLGGFLAALNRSGNYVAAKTFLDTWGAELNELKPVLEGLRDIPVDIEPVYAY